MEKQIARRAKRFTEVYEAAEQIPFKTEWSNGTGYFNFAVGASRRPSPHAPVIPVGEVRASATPTGRRLLFISTYLGLMVIFDRYDDRKDVFTYNEDDRIRSGRWVSERAISDDDMEFLLGLQGASTIRGGIADVIREVREHIITDLKKGKGA